jgi:multiple sugar transport system substrate-binding protein
MSAKHTVVLILLFLSIAELSCTRHRKEASNGVTVKFWHSFVSSSIPALNELIRLFEEEHPAIRIDAQYVPTGDGLIQKLQAAIRSNTTPDVSWIHADFLDKLVEANALVPMHEFVSGPDGFSKEEMEDFVPTSLESGKWRGKIYALPMEATSLALIYNRDAFRQAGLDPEHPPRDWNELRTFTRRLTVDFDHDGRTDQYGFFVPVFPASGELNIWMMLQWTPFLWQAGGTEINHDQTKVLFNSEAGIQALSLWKALYDDMDFSRFALAHDIGFASGKLAMVMDGPWNLPRYRALKNIDWAVAPLPRGPVMRATYLAGELTAIFSQSSHQKEAWTFVKWITEPRIQSLFSIKSGYLPIRKSVLNRPEYVEYLKSDPALSAFVEQIGISQARVPLDRHRVEINRVMAEAIEQATLGKGDPRRCLDKAAEKANDFLK